MNTDDSDDDLPPLEEVTDSASENSSDGYDDDGDDGEDEDVEIEVDEEVEMNSARSFVGSWATDQRHLDNTLEPQARPEFASPITDHHEEPSGTSSQGVDTNLETPPEDSRKHGNRTLDGAFTTDGRGRVISVGDDEGENSTEATSSENPVDSRSPEGGGLFHWISSIF